MMDSALYTCNTCLVGFRSSDAQREHMRRDWHLYNMKRRIASLAPVSQEIFNEKVLAARASSTAAAAKASFEKTCSACQKTFYSENSYQNHERSSKHRLREMRMNKNFADDSSSVLSSTFSLGEPINQRRSSRTELSSITSGMKSVSVREEEKEDEEEEDQASGDDGDDSSASAGYSIKRCLFCNTKWSDVDANIEHMLKTHGMFIPERSYLVDLNGLIVYLHRKINENSECLYCHAIRNNPVGARTHMRDKGHCMIAFETEEEQIEIGQFYDFRSTYSDGDEEWEDEPESDAKEDGGVKVLESGDDDEGWATEDSASIESDEDADSRKKAPVIYQSEYELHLPSGRSVGHRSLAKYYRQNLHNYLTPEERVARQLAIENGEIQEEEHKGRNNHHRAIITRANGGMGMIGATDSQKRAALGSERRERTQALRQELRNAARVQKAANNQKHFRDPLLQ